MKLNVSDKHFLEIIERGYSMDIVFLLKLIHEGNEIDSLCNENVKISAMKQSLIRKQLITEEGKIMSAGEELILFLNTKIAGKIVRKIPNNSDFDDFFWNIYPPTDSFSYEGKKFTGSRGLRQDKENCRLKFEKIITEGEYKPEQISAAIKLEVEQKIQQSFKTGTNKLSYMKNSLSYLNQRAFEPYIELLKTDIVTEQKTYNGTDI